MYVEPNMMANFMASVSQFMYTYTKHAMPKNRLLL